VLPYTPTLRLGYSEFYPYVTADQAGNPAGLAVQIVQQAAARSGVPMTPFLGASFLRAAVLFRPGLDRTLAPAL
jgi:hypothetical protein